MPVVSFALHPKGLHPIEAVKAWHKWKEQEMSLDDILEEAEIQNLEGDVPGRHSLWNAINSVEKIGKRKFVPESNCGKELLTDERKEEVIEFAKKWRHTRFCTCATSSTS